MESEHNALYHKPSLKQYNEMKSDLFGTNPEIERIHRNCTPSSLDDFPNWAFTAKPFNLFETIVAIIISSYSFYGLAIVCDEYFIPALEVFAFKVGMSYNIAATTILVVATSAPELFVSLIGTFITEGDVGVGTIVGTLGFNSLAIIGVCCMFSKWDIAIDWWPLSRDILWYAFSLALLTLLIMRGYVWWYSGLLMFIVYLIHLTSLLFDHTLQVAVRGELGFTDFFEEDPMETTTEEPYKFFEIPSGKCAKVNWILSWPLQCLFYITVPNVRFRHMRSCYMLGLVLSIGWVCLLCYICTWMWAVIGNNVYMPDSLMGIVFLAAGTSVPELIASAILTKKGHATMAISNALGSNSFDVLVCLGVPWIIKGALLSHHGDGKIYFSSFTLGYVSSSLVLTALLMFLSFWVMKFVLCRSIGIFLLLIFICFISFAAYMETIYGLPPCPS